MQTEGSDSPAIASQHWTFHVSYRLLMVGETLLYAALLC